MVFCPLRVEDHGEGLSEKGRLANVWNYIHEARQFSKVYLTEDREVTLVRERGQVFFVALLGNCGVTCAFYESERPYVAIYGQQVNKRMAERALRMWLSDPEQDVWARATELLVDGKAVAYCISIVEPPYPIDMKVTAERHHVPGPREVTRDLCLTIERACNARVDFTQNGPAVWSVYIEGYRPQVELAKIMLEHWRRGGTAAIICSPWLVRPASSPPPSPSHAHTSPDASDHDEEEENEEEEADDRSSNPHRPFHAANGSTGTTSSSASSSSSSSPLHANRQSSASEHSVDSSPRSERRLMRKTSGMVVDEDDARRAASRREKARRSRKRRAADTEGIERDNWREPHDDRRTSSPFNPIPPSVSSAEGVPSLPPPPSTDLVTPTASVAPPPLPAGTYPMVRSFTFLKRSDPLGDAQQVPQQKRGRVAVVFNGPFSVDHHLTSVSSDNEEEVEEGRRKKRQRKGRREGQADADSGSSLEQRAPGETVSDDAKGQEEGDSMDVEDETEPLIIEEEQLGHAKAEQGEGEAMEIGDGSEPPAIEEGQVDGTKATHSGEAEKAMQLAAQRGRVTLASQKPDGKSLEPQQAASGTTAEREANREAQNEQGSIVTVAELRRSGRARKPAVYTTADDFLDDSEDSSEIESEKEGIDNDRSTSSAASCGGEGNGPRSVEVTDASQQVQTVEGPASVLVDRSEAVVTTGGARDEPSALPTSDDRSEETTFGRSKAGKGKGSGMATVGAEGSEGTAKGRRSVTHTKKGATKGKAPKRVGGKRRRKTQDSDEEEGEQEGEREGTMDVHDKPKVKKAAPRASAKKKLCMADRTAVPIARKRPRRRRRKQSDASDIEDADYEIEDDEERMRVVEARRAAHVAGQQGRMAKYDVDAMFAAVREQFKQRFSDDEYTDDDFVLIKEEPGCANPDFDMLATALPNAPQTLILHGTKVDYAKRILRRGFDPKKVGYLINMLQIRSGGDEGSKEAVFYFASDPGIADRWRKGDEVVDGELWAHCVVSVMLWARGSNIKLSGCTGGTIKVPARAHRLIQPVFRFKYRSPIKQLKHTFQNKHLHGKNQLEDPGLLPPKIWKEVSAATGTRHPQKVLPMHINEFLLPYQGKPSITSLALDFR